MSAPAMKITDADLDVWLETDDGRMYNLTVSSELRGRWKKHVYEWHVAYYVEPLNEDLDPQPVSWGREKSWEVAKATAFEQAEIFEKGIAFRRDRR